MTYESDYHKKVRENREKLKKRYPLPDPHTIGQRFVESSIRFFASERPNFWEPNIRRFFYSPSENDKEKTKEAKAEELFERYTNDSDPAKQLKVANAYSMACRNLNSEDYGAKSMFWMRRGTNE